MVRLGSRQKDTTFLDSSPIFTLPSPHKISTGRLQCVVRVVWHKAVKAKAGNGEGKHWLCFFSFTLQLYLTLPTIFFWVALFCAKFFMLINALRKQDSSFPCLAFYSCKERANYYCIESLRNFMYFIFPHCSKQFHG